VVPREALGGVGQANARCSAVPHRARNAGRRRGGLTAANPAAARHATHSPPLPARGRRRGRYSQVRS
jgi:hypothetical protein